MRQILFTIGLMAISSFIFAQTVKINLIPEKTELTKIVSKSNAVTFTSTLSKLAIKETKVKTLEFFKINYNGYTKNINIGEPNVPVVTSLIEIPLGASLNVNIISSQHEIIDLNEYGIVTQLEPVQRSISKSEDASKVEFTKNDNTYNKNAFYANDIVNVEILGISRDKRIARITVSPIQYNAVTNKLKVFYNITAEVSFANADYSATNELKAKTASPYFYSTSSLTINKIESTSKDAITHYPTKMVIVSDPMFETQLQDFINWKRRKGFTVIEAYTNNSSVGTTTSSIKTYLEGLYNDGTASDPAPSFVLFVGDVEQIPTYSGNTATHKTDLYYCEYTGDYFPEVYYGRWSAQNTSQLQPQIDKTMEYEQYLMPDPSYLGHVLMVAGVDGSMAEVHGNGQLQYGMENYFNTAHGMSVYEYLYPLSDQAASVTAIKADFNTGVGYTNYTAHCSPAGWADPSFTVYDVPYMTNAHKYGLMVSNCCQSNTFVESECWGEALLRKENAGTVGAIGGSNLTYWDEDYHWGVGAQNIQATPPVSYDATRLGAYDRVFHENGEAEADWFVTNAAVMYAGNMAVEQAGDGKKNYYWEIYHLMGDPSLMNYFGVPTALTVNYSDPITSGETSLTVTTEQYAYVAISQNNVLLDAQYTGANTSVTLNFPAFGAPGTADIVITKQNKQPYIGTLTIMNNNVDNDAGIASITKPTTVYNCIGTSVNPVVEIRNGGQSALTSCTVKYSFDNGTPETFNWTGNLATNATATVSFTSSITLTAGAHTFKAYTELPNGVADEYTGNDELEINITVADNPIVADFTTSEVESCVTPFTVDFQNTSTNANTYTWTFGDGATSTEASPSHTYTTDGLYTVTLVADAGECGNDEEVKTNYINVDSSIPCDYCDAGATGTYEYIDGVECGTISNMSTGSSTGGYGDYTSMSADMEAGQTYSITVTGGNVFWADNAYAWIDWNRDGDFDDTDEYVFASSTQGEASYTFDVTVPNSVSFGSTRLRIRWTDDNDGGTNTTACGNSSYGEVEDYTINLTVATGINTTINKNIFEVYPNPSNGIFTISTINNTNTNIQITNILGSVVYSNKLNSTTTTINLSSFDKGVYFVRVNGGNTTETKSIVIK